MFGKGKGKGKGKRKGLVALWPLAIRNETGARVLTPLGAPYDQYAEILIDRHADVDAVLAGVIGAFRKEKLADGMVLRKLRRSGDALRLARLGGRIIDEHISAPQVILDPAAPFDDFLKTVKSKTRKNLRNYTNRLSKLGTLEHVVLTGGQVAPAIDQSYNTRKAWTQTKGMSSSAFRDAGFERIVQGLSGPGAANLGLIIFALKLDDRAIALQWGFIHEKTYYAYLSSLDPEFEAYSAGRIHLKYVIEACHARGLTKLDLMAPAVPYKMSWTQTADPLVDLVWPWTPRGLITFNIYGAVLRPGLKRLVQALPLGLRQKLFQAVNAD